MASMFYGSNCNCSLDFDISNVQNMSYMFNQSNFFENGEFDFDNIKTWTLNVNCDINNAFNYYKDTDVLNISNVIRFINDRKNSNYMVNMLK
jgi:hypothetical protein